MPDIHFHLARPGPRSRYIARHLLIGMTGWEAREVEDLESFRTVDGPKLIYGPDSVEGAFHIRPEGFLEQAGISAPEPARAEWQGLPVIFPAGPADVPFDLFAAAFFHLSRYEEHGTIARDPHGRPLTASLHSARHGFLLRPLVDEWLIAMADAWRAKDPRLPALRRTYRHCATLDVDNGAMYLGRPLWRSLGGMARDLLKGRPGQVADRIATLAHRRPDPYAVQAGFVALAKLHGARTIVNFLVAPRGPHDHAIGPEHAFIRSCMQAMGRESEVGLHPGYASSDHEGAIQREKSHLEQVLGHPIALSRQHYLRMKLPGTYRELEHCGIREEHSMGLADAIGFRASTCTPFPFYDLEAEEETTIMVHPFAVMDSAMAYRMKLGPDAAIGEAKRLVDAVRRVQGTFTSVWHERFLSGYGDERGWGQVAGEVIEHARP